MSEEQQRKGRVSVNLEIFDPVKRLYITKTNCSLFRKTRSVLEKSCNTIETAAHW